MKLMLKLYAILTGLLALSGIAAIGVEFVRNRLEERRFKTGMDEYYKNHPL